MVTKLFSDPVILDTCREAASNAMCIATLESCADAFSPGRGSTLDRLELIAEQALDVQLEKLSSSDYGS